MTDKIRKYFDKQGRQGDLLVMKVTEVPGDFSETKVNGQHFMVAHSESGHHHVVEAEKVQVFEKADDQFCLYIRTLSEEVELEHLKTGADAHQTIVLMPNEIYKIRRGRENSPLGWRRAID